MSRTPDTPTAAEINRSRCQEALRIVEEIDTIVSSSSMLGVTFDQWMQHNPQVSQLQLACLEQSLMRLKMALHLADEVVF